VSVRRVTIVSRHTETRETLQAYLRESGLDVHALDSADVERVASRACAVVLFPDDFSDRRALAFVESMRRLQPGVLLIIVTRQPHRLTGLVADGDRSVRPLVLPRPSFGWSILDAIRAHVTTEERA
jgi:DNA-binding response OmpR family regulator